MSNDQLHIWSNSCCKAGLFKVPTCALQLPASWLISFLPLFLCSYKHRVYPLRPNFKFYQLPMEHFPMGATPEHAQHSATSEPFLSKGVPSPLHCPSGSPLSAPSPASMHAPRALSDSPLTDNHILAVWQCLPRKTKPSIPAENQFRFTDNILENKQKKKRKKMSHSISQLLVPFIYESIHHLFLCIYAHIFTYLLNS